MNKSSDQLNELFAALSKAQGQIKAASKDGNNPFYKSKYATLESCWESCREALSANGLSIAQTLEDDHGKLFLVTVLGHSSGQYITSKMPLISKSQDAHSIAGSVTYWRRFSLASLVGLTADEDDDGGRAMKESKEPKSNPVVTVSLQQFKDAILNEEDDADFGNLESYLSFLASTRNKTKEEIMAMAVSSKQLIQRFVTNWKLWENN